ncbi:hypothetical protein PO909_029527 [Leuciscus waleckii]
MEEAMCDLKVFIWDSGRGKLNSSNYTTVKTADRKVETADVLVVGVSEGDGSLILLCEDFTEFIVSTDLYHGSVEDLIDQLPVHIQISHANTRVISINFN